jgi:hypothetical protein
MDCVAVRSIEKKAALRPIGDESPRHKSCKKRGDHDGRPFFYLHIRRSSQIHQHDFAVFERRHSQY